MWHTNDLVLGVTKVKTAKGQWLAAGGGEEDLLSAGKEFSLMTSPFGGSCWFSHSCACPMKVGRDVWWQGEKEMVIY